MRHIIIYHVPGFQEWRDAAKEALEDGISPEQVYWQAGQDIQEDLFTVTRPHQQKQTEVHERSSHDWCRIASPHSTFPISKKFLELCEMALCHHNSDRFFLCYRVLWRLTHENKNLLHLKTDDDMMYLNALIKAVQRDAYKMTAFLRFRQITHKNAEHFLAWYEPEHYTLELKLDFFKTRFKNMRWSILTPYRAAHWDTKCLMLEDNPDPSQYPQGDNIEKYWLTYYANIFNPARSNKQAMMSQMPKKYWKNMPETGLIGGLLENSEAKTCEMLK